MWEGEVRRGEGGVWEGEGKESWKGEERKGEGRGGEGVCEGERSV